MATIVNNPSTDSGSGAGGWAIAIVLVVIVALALLFGLPALRNAGGGTQVNIPDSIDLNVNGGGGAVGGQ